MSKRGLLLCNLARQEFNTPSSEKQALSKEAHYEKSHKVCEVVPEQDKSKHNVKDFKVLQWLNDNQSTDYVEENTAQLIEKSDNVEEIINYANEGNITGETSQLGQINTETGSKETSEQVIKITENAEETTKQLNEKTDTKQLKEKTDNVHEINIYYVKEGNTTGETSQSRKNNTEVGFESDGTDFSGTDTDKDFVPDKRRKRKIIPSSSSSSSSSSTSSSSSDSESTKSINLLNIPNQTNTQLLDAHVPPLIVQQIATQDSNNESNTEMTSQFDCEFQNTPVATKAKKRAKNSAAWKQNKRKALKNSGQEHTSSTGKNIPAKKMGSPCTEKCLYSCSKIISDEHRQKLFEEYWKLGCLTRQRDFVASCIFYDFVRLSRSLR